MDDILPLLNITIPYEERISQINTLVKQPNSKYTLLNLNVVSSTLKYPKSVYSISPLGLQNSKRNGKDGIVLFGYERNKENKSSENNVNINSESNSDDDKIKENKEFLFNDFIFPVENPEDNNGLYDSPNFSIYYNIDEERYEMEGNTLINIGGNYLVVYLEKNRILIKIFNNSVLENTYDKESTKINCDIKQIDIDPKTNSYTYIGRSQNCDIVIEDMMLSKTQCCIEYDAESKKIYLSDGDGKKESTNGTWVFILNPTKITDNFMFKAEHTLFLANLAQK